MVGYRGDKYEWKCLQIHYDRYLAGRRKIGSIPGTSSEVPKKVPAMVSTRTMSTVTAGGESSAGPSRSLRHHTVTPAHDLNKGAGSSVTLMQLPQEVLEHVLNFLPNSTIGLLRQVCRRMDVLCGGLLNLKFQGLQTRMLSRFQAIKGKMPRRESARRNHPLACESDIIETLHMRLTLLQMSFGKHIERKHCCFFAGEILDEVYRILHYIEVTPKLGRPYKVTDELFDLSTMAMEYFKEHIEPTLPEIAYFGSEFLGEYSSPFPAFEDTTPASISSSSKSEDTSISGPPQSNMVLRKRIRRIKQGMKRYRSPERLLMPINVKILKYNNQLSMLRRDLRACKGKIAEQQKQICDYSSRLDDCDKKNEETARKFSTLLQELNKCKTELQYWRSKAPANLPTCRGCGKPFVPAVNEDLAVLANQGVLPWEELIEPGPSNAGRADDESKPGCSKRKVEEAPTVNQEPKKPKKRVLKSRRK